MIRRDPVHATRWPPRWRPPRFSLRAATQEMTALPRCPSPAQLPARPPSTPTPPCPSPPRHRPRQQHRAPARLRPTTTPPSTTSTTTHQHHHDEHQQHDDDRAGTGRLRPRMRRRGAARRLAQLDHRPLRRRHDPHRHRACRERHRGRDDLPGPAPRHLRRQRPRRHHRLRTRAQRSDRRQRDDRRDRGATDQTQRTVRRSGNPRSARRRRLGPGDPPTSLRRTGQPRPAGHAHRHGAGQRRGSRAHGGRFTPSPVHEFPQLGAMDPHRPHLSDHVRRRERRAAHVRVPDLDGRDRLRDTRSGSFARLPLRPRTRQRRMAQQHDLSGRDRQPAQRQHVQAALLRWRPGDPRSEQRSHHTPEQGMRTLCGRATRTY